MKSWRDSILDEFVPRVNKLTLVADPDGLLTEEKLACDLRARGFDLIEFNDAVEFRYAYESNYRALWDQGGQTDLVVVLRLQDGELDTLPYDLLQAGRKLSFSLGHLFPKLSYPVIECLDRSLLDALHEAQQKSPPDVMGDNSTKDFILRHVFGIAAELITTEVELLRTLLRVHYGRMLIPQLLSERLTQVLTDEQKFKDWPLESIVLNDASFYFFLQERWPIHLAGSPQTETSKERRLEYGLRYSGPDLLPFDHPDIRVYIDNLFLEGKLASIEADPCSVTFEAFALSDVTPAHKADSEARIRGLFELVEKTIPGEDSRFPDWTSLALKWAELSALIHCANGEEFQQRFLEVGDRINSAFAPWLHGHFASLITQPPIRPAMLHHVPRRLARDIEESNTHRVALIVMDGLSLDQWVTIRPILQEQDPSLTFSEHATFAWTPTLTSVSRQSIFSGKIPAYYPATINSTHAEEKLWKQFWEGHGLSKQDVVYKRGLPNGDPSDMIDALVHPAKTRVVGLVVDIVDKIMHGMQLGSAGMHNSITQWCRSGYLSDLVNTLLDLDFTIWLTADHGNIECKGMGRPAEGVVAETRGERARIYPSAELRTGVAEAFPFARDWPTTGLPNNYFPLVADGRGAFALPGESLVSHGGISIEEVIVPFVRINRA